MDTLSLLGSIAGLGLASGIRLYATVLGLGLGIHFGVFEPRPELSQLRMLASPWVMGAAALAYLFEFLADKIPWVDSLWDSFHTFIRPLGAALLAATSLGTMSTEAKIGAAVLAGGVALTGHSAKAGTRLAANQSPEPFSNLGLSLAEDVFAMVATWLSMTHPVVMFAIVAIFLAVFLWAAPKVFRLARVEWHALKAFVGRWVGAKREASAERIRCVAGEGIGGLRNSIGELLFEPGGAVFVTRRLFRTRRHRIDLSGIQAPELRRNLLSDSVSYEAEGKRRTLHFFKERSKPAERFFAALKESAPPARAGSA